MYVIILYLVFTFIILGDLIAIYFHFCYIFKS